ncbi:hypothetical protein E2320_011516 [Naja naja]|nr:hypothetical protein E2320_011516 [Naja naja]
MGGQLSTQQKVHAKELHKILKQQSKTGGISLRDIEDLITEIGYQCPWYLEKGSLDLGDWIKIGVHLHSEPRAPIQHLLLWQTKGSSSIQAGFKEAQEKGELTSEELTEGLNAFPVQEQVDAQGKFNMNGHPYLIQF